MKTPMARWNLFLFFPRNEFHRVKQENICALLSRQKKINSHFHFFFILVLSRKWGKCFLNVLYKNVGKINTPLFCLPEKENGSFYDVADFMEVYMEALNSNINIQKYISPHSVPPEENKKLTRNQEGNHKRGGRGWRVCPYPRTLEKICTYACLGLLIQRGNNLAPLKQIILTIVVTLFDLRYIFLFWNYDVFSTKPFDFQEEASVNTGRFGYFGYNRFREKFKF